MAEMTTIRQLVAEDLESFLEVRSVSFPPPSDMDRESYNRLMAERIPDTRGLFVGEELACVITMYPSEIYFAGSSVPMGALAGVASAPQYRRRGHVRELLLDGLERLHGEGVGWCLEYPFDPRFYSRLGWQSVPSAVDLEIPCEFLFAGPPPAAERLSFAEFASLAPIYDTWAERYNFCLTRKKDPRDAWNRLVSDHWLDEGGFLFQLEGAYVLFSLIREGGQAVAVVEDYAYDGAEARAHLFGLIGSLHGQADTVRITLPSDDPIALDHQPRHVRSRRWPMQARIVDLQAALTSLTSESAHSFTMRVIDEQCVWNHGTFSVSSGPNGSEVSRGDGPADVTLPVQTLPLLLGGLLSPAAALGQGLAEGGTAALASLAGLGGCRTPFMPRSDAF